MVCFRFGEDGHSHFETRVTEYAVWHAVAMSMRSSIHGKAHYKICTSLKKSQYSVSCVRIRMHVLEYATAMQTALERQQR